MVISSLFVAEAARTSTLTKSWQGLWRHAECLEFDETTMPRPSILLEKRQIGTGSLYATVIGFKTLEINNLWLKFLELGWLIVNKVDLSVEGLETLVVDSLMYPSKDLKIYTINPRILHVSCNSIAQRMRIRSSRQQTFFGN
ncbi:uncharacterized protein DS421_18g620020 [Arachis hypogaea]|nr:uncharacterized protein DS421_18g620020 [Arachis hypogaea]